MSETVESLDIKINATAKSAKDEITNLVGKIDVLTSSLSKINGSNLSGLANGVSKLGNATKKLSGVKATDYNRIAKGFERFAKIDVGGLSRTASGLNTLANGLNNLGNIQNLGGITSAVNAVKNLSKVNMAGFDTSKMTEIANSVSDLATKLSGVSAIESTVTRVVGSLARLSNSGQYIGNVTTEFPILGEQVVKLVGKLSSANAIDISITKVVEGIAKLANAGKRVGETVANLDKLGNGVMNLLKKLQNAPQINSNVANTIQGLGNLASSGSRISTVSDRASTSTKKLGNALSSLKDKLKSAHKSSKGFVSSIGMFYAKFFLVIRAVKKFGQAIGSAQDYIEEFNYFSVALDKVGKDSANQFKKAGYNSAEEYAGSFRKRFGKLQKQLTGYDVDYNTGDATNTFSHNLGLDLTEVMNYNAAIAQITNSAGMLGETSIDSAKALTMLSADWASLSNLDTADVMQNFQSGLVGQSRALYKYGIEITSAGLAQTAMNHGITESIKNLSQQSKMQLRVLTMLEQSKVAYADLARTINQPANQLRMLQAGFKKLSLTIGSLFMPIVQKLYPYMNAVVMVLQDFAQWVAKLAGIKLGDTDGSRKTPEVPDYSNAADDTDKVAKNMDKTAKKTKKAADNLQGFDIVNKLQDNSDSDSGDTDPSGGNANIDLSKDISDALKNYEKIWDNAFKSNQNKAVELYKKMKKAILDAWKGGDFTSLGSALANWINKGMRNIPWTKIKKTTKKIAKSLATFLNGFVKDLDWTKLGENFSEGLNTWFETSYTFFKTFDWLKFGQSIKEGITAAINTFDGDLAGKSLGAKLRGMIQFAFGVMVDFPYKNLGKKIGDYINGFLEEMGEVRKNTGLTGWQELGKTISDGITGILDTIDTALSTVNWWEVGKAIGDFLSEIEWGKTLLKVGKIIVKGLFNALKVAISAFIRDPLGIAFKLSTVLIGVFAYKKLKTLWKSLKIVFSDGISNSLISAKINSKGLTDKFSGLGSKMGRAMGVALVAAYGWWENSITAGGDAKGNVERYASGTDDKSMLLKEVVQMMDKFGYGSNTNTVDRLVGRLNKKLESGEISEKTIRKALDKDYKTMTDKQSVQSAADFLDLLGESKGNVATKIDKGKKELNDYKPIITQTTKYSKAVDTLNKKMKKLGISSSESKSIQDKLKKALEDGEITWEDYRKITDKNYKSTDALKKKIDSLKPKSVKVKAETSGGDDVDSLQGKVDSVNSKTVTITAGIKGVDIKTFGDLSIAMKNMKNRDINVNISANLRKAWYKSVQKELYSRTFSINANTKVIKASGKEVEKATKSQTGKKYNGEKFKKLMNAVGTTQDQWGRVVIPGAIDYNGSSKKAKAAQQSKKWKELIKYLKKYGIATNNPILFANGGFPEDGWFRASHGEMMGKFDNGKSVVANNKQITTGISEAVAPAVYAATKAAIKEELSNANVGGGDVYLDGTKVTTAIMNNAKKISKNKGISWNMA
nr:MAG TPA: minor tail protein [Caudoviricetes sp.]